MCFVIKEIEWGTMLRTGQQDRMDTLSLILNQSGKASQLLTNLKSQRKLNDIFFGEVGGGGLVVLCLGCFFGNTKN